MGDDGSFRGGMFGRRPVLKPEGLEEKEPKKSRAYYVPLMYPEKLYPMTFHRLIEKYGLIFRTDTTVRSGKGKDQRYVQGFKNSASDNKYYNGYDSDGHSPLIAALRRDIKLMQRDTRDALHLAAISEMSGVPEADVLKVLDAFFDKKLNARDILPPATYRERKETVEYENQWDAWSWGKQIPDPRGKQFGIRIVRDNETPFIPIEEHDDWQDDDEAGRTKVEL